MKTIQDKNIKILILVSSVLTLLLLLAAAVQENIVVQWKDYQKRYFSALRAAAPADKQPEVDIKLRQIFLAELNSADRCITCHIGIEDPAMARAEQPLQEHSGDMLKRHPMNRFGCTVCHDGQGLATTRDDAHGETEFWPAPLLRGERVYTSCGRCHYEGDLYGAEYDLFTKGVAPPQLMHEELISGVPGGNAINRGKQLVIASGCLGCHKYRNKGGTLGPDITYIGDKDKSGFNFGHVQGEHTVAQWLFEHFKNPDRLSPGTLMPDMHLADQQARDLAAYMLSLHRKSMPATHTPVPPRRAGNAAGGFELYTLFCSSCHGNDGQGSTVRVQDAVLARAADVPRDLMVPSLSNPDTLGTASDDYFKSIIMHGREGTNMIAWGEASAGGLQPGEINRLVSFVRSWEPPSPDIDAVAASRGNAGYGAMLYEQNCAACHGSSGEGGIGTTLNSPTFLAVASDEFLARALINGRPNTAMPGWKQLDSQMVSDIIAHLRCWHEQKNDRAKTLQQVGTAGIHPSVTVAIGRTLYEANCVVCHGASGEGDLGPSLATEEFLSLAGDEFLYDTIALGRPGTGMPAWRHFSNNDMASVVAFVRSWQRGKSRPLSKIPVGGDWDAGEMLFKKLCSSCHGADAEGGVGPQLNNPVFLQTASDAMIFEWIANGKAGTQMRSFTKGGQGMVEISPAQIFDIVSFVRSLERRQRVSVARSPSGRPELGELLFKGACSSCHGERGEGASGPSLSNRGFLRAASDGYLMAMMSLGRDGTEMRPVKKSAQSIISLSSDDINDLVAFIRSWEDNPPAEGVLHRFVVPWDLKSGYDLYASNCAGCHGKNGKAELAETGPSAWAPALNNEGFLAAATDGFMQATIVRGRAATAMKPFGRGMQGLVDLTPDDINDIVSFIRRWSQYTVAPMTIPAEHSSGPGEVKSEK